MTTIELKFNQGQKVWLMYNNRPTCAPISEIHITKEGISYFFWHQDFSSKDSSLCYSNLFTVGESRLFTTKEELLDSFKT